MTPQEQFEYKQKWLPHAEEVLIHSDFRNKAKYWLKQNVPAKDYKYVEYTCHYEDTVYFHFDDALVNEFWAQFAIDRDKD